MKAFRPNLIAICLVAIAQLFNLTAIAQDKDKEKKTEFFQKVVIPQTEVYFDKRKVDNNGDVTIQAQNIQGVLVLEGKIGNKRPGYWVIATTAPVSAVSLPIARAIGLIPSTSIPKRQEPNSLYTGAIMGNGITFNGIEIQVPALPIGSFQAVSQALQVNIHGVIGHDVLKQMPVTLDYANSTITFHNVDNFKAPAGAKKHNVDVSNDKIIIPAKLNGKVDAKLQLSTLFNGQIGLYKQFVANKGQQLANPERTIAKPLPFTKQDVRLVMNQLDSIQLFDIDFKHPIAQYQYPGEQTDKQLIADGDLGTSVLAGHALTINIREGHLYLKKVKRPSIRQQLAMGLNLNKSNTAGDSILVNAVLKGDKALVKELLESGANPNRKSENGSLALHAAVTRPDVEMVKLLINNGADAFLRDANGSTAVIAAARGLNEVLQLMLKQEPGEGREYLKSIDRRNDAGATAFVLAAQAGNISNCKLLVTKKADINLSTHYGETALMYAVINQDIEMVKYLIKLGANINAQSKKGFSALMAAIDKNNDELIKILLDAKADFKQRSVDGITPLMLAAKNGNLNTLKFLLDNGVEVDQESAVGETALFFAAQRQHTDCIKLLIERKANYEHRDLSGRSVFMILCAGKNVQIVKDILALQKKDELDELINAESTKGLTPLIAATQSSSVELIKVLTAAGADVEYMSLGGNTALLFALKANPKPAVIKALLDAGADYDAINKNQETPLIIATSRGLEEEAEMLINAGADVNSKTLRDETVIGFAALNMSAKFIQKLLDKGAQANTQDQNQFTPLMLAASSGNLDGVKTLLNSIENPAVQKAYLNIKTKTGETALMLAARNYNTETLKYLIDKGMNVNETNAQGFTALFFATISGNEEAIKILAKSGANINHQNTAGLTALMASAQIRHIRSMRALLKLGADQKPKDLLNRTHIQYIEKEDWALLQQAFGE